MNSYKYWFINLCRATVKILKSRDYCLHLMVRMTVVLRTLASVLAASQLYLPACCRRTSRITKELRLVTTPALLFCTTLWPWNTLLSVITKGVYLVLGHTR